MILSKQMMLKAFSSGYWGSNVSFRDLHFSPNSVDVTLSPHFLIQNRDIRKVLLKDNKVVSSLTGLGSCDEIELYRKVSKEALCASPGELFLGSTNEMFDTSKPLLIDGKPRKFVQMYDGRSTLARLGIMSHVSAGFGDYGFKGSWTLEIINHANWKVELFAGMRIGQVYFVELGIEDGIDEEGYNGYDQTNGLPLSPKLGKGRF